jgi:hypothetical protein
MIPHPFKTDTWVEGDRSGHLNACQEIFLPTSIFNEDSIDNNVQLRGNTPVADLCVLGMKQSFLDYAALRNDIHMTQVHAKVKRLLEHEKIINSFWSGATPNQLMPDLDVEALAIRLISEHEEDLTWLDNSLGAVRMAMIEERSKLFSSFAVNNSMKELGTMQSTTDLALAMQTQNVLSKSAPGYIDPHHPDANHGGPAELRGGFKRDDLVTVNAITDGVKSLGALIEGAEKATDESSGRLNVPKLKGLDSFRRVPKRKKSKPKSKHLPNMNNARVKSALGTVILMKLGQIQRDTSDSQKKALLKELPAADLLEMATGEKLPEYQANLINGMQAKADPDAPIVKRMADVATPFGDPALGMVHLDPLPYLDSETGERKVLKVELDPADPEPGRTVEVIQDAVLGRGLTNSVMHLDVDGYLTKEQRQEIWVKNLDIALATYIHPDLFPGEMSPEVCAEVATKLRAYLIEKNAALDEQTIVQAFHEVLKAD